MSKILLIEDDSILLQMYKDKFVQANFAVETADDGEEGINKMRSFSPDAVILDLMMPERSGFDVLKFAKDDPDLKTIPIIVLTNVTIDGKEIITNWGARAFLLKADNTPDQVLATVNQLLQAAPTS